MYSFAFIFCSLVLSRLMERMDRIKVYGAGILLYVRTLP